MICADCGAQLRVTLLRSRVERVRHVNVRHEGVIGHARFAVSETALEDAIDPVAIVEYSTHEAAHRLCPRTPDEHRRVTVTHIAWSPFGVDEWSCSGMACGTCDRG